MKLKQIRIAKGRQQKELARKIGTDEPMMSKFENYKCLPVPSMMKLLTEELGVSIDDIYEPHEIYMQGVRAKESTPRKKVESEVYHLTVNLPPEASNDHIGSFEQACPRKMGKQPRSSRH
ncbi:MAG: helix-turn-helix transcriptional regulator [Clostridia bacterium]|nr:helix-turn-helix transcriptional regulator [Clostridia bacterium]